MARSKVYPIKDKEKIKALKVALLETGFRDYLLSCLILETGYRGNDILDLKVKDVVDKKEIEIIEKSTGKKKKIEISEQLQEDIKKYISNKNPEEYLFASQLGGEPITPTQAYRIISQAGKKAGLEGVSLHSLRKTFGYWHFVENKDINFLQKHFNHSAPIVTYRYIDINREERKKILKKSKEG